MPPWSIQTSIRVSSRWTLVVPKHGRFATLVRVSSLFVFDLLSRMGRVEEDFTDHLLHSSEMRLARLLLRLSHFGERNAADSAVLHVSQETLAEMVGTTRSRVSYFMNRFRESGFIDYNGSLRVHKALRTFLLCK